ncbi:hypothetical protein J4443_01865 [Candidatus Woesearchaeota archaeon]|nr:hypothetical protein [Candidatus Woesearchaeota archaeon]
MKKRGYIFIIIGILILLSPIYFIFKPKTCETAGCFEAAATECKKAKILVDEAGKSVSEYTIKSEEDENCLLEIEVKKLSGDYSQSTKERFEKKSMLCKIPTNEFSRMKFEKMGGNLDYCSGPLKEAMYDAVVKKLYNLVIKDMSTVLDEIERKL